MQYYTFAVDDEAKDLCTICTPFGLFWYLQLCMGVSQSSDIAQEIMETVFHELNEVGIYIDNVGIFNNSWEEHL